VDILKILSESEASDQNFKYIKSDRSARSLDDTATSERFLRATSPGNSDDDEMKLVNYLLHNYNKEVRPVKDKNDAVQVVFGLAYTQLLDLVSLNSINQEIN